MCPDREEKLREALGLADDLLRRLDEWDQMNVTGGSDGPYWKREIAKVRAALSVLDGEGRQGTEVTPYHCSRHGFVNESHYPKCPDEGPPAGRPVPAGEGADVEGAILDAAGAAFDRGHDQGQRYVIAGLVGPDERGDEARAALDRAGWTLTPPEPIRAARGPEAPSTETDGGKQGRNG